MHSEQKIALLHYWLLGMRGGEMVFDELCRMFPAAEVYTHAVFPENISAGITRHPVHESFIARLPFGLRHCQKYLPLMPSALKGWDFSQYDLLISSESGPVKGIRKPRGCRHICYCHTPMRYLWDMYDDYYASASIPGKMAMRICKNYLRRYDLKSAECVDQFIANSGFVAERIQRIYGRGASVVYPPVDVEYFQKAPELERKHYLFVGQLVCYKRPDLAIAAFSRLPHEELLIVGEGPMRKQLEKLATQNVRFTGWVPKEKLRALYASAKALIFPGIEDFGIVPVEAMAARCPVIAMNCGGTAETVTDGVTGIRIKAQTEEAILNAVEELSLLNTKDITYQEQSARFGIKRFQEQIQTIICQGEI